MPEDQGKIRFEYFSFVIILLLAIIYLGNVSPQIASSSQNPVELFPLSDKPFGLSYEDHAKNFWKLYLSIPLDKNTLEDRSGALCNYGQNGQNETKTVFYLTGNSGGKTEKTCNLPAGLSILIPLLVGEASQGEAHEGKLPTVDELRTNAKSDQDRMKNLKLEINGKDIPEENLRRYALLTGDFDVIFPDNAEFGANPGPSKVVSDGYWVITKPLSPGNYTIKFSGYISAPPEDPTSPFSTESIYHLIVK